MRVDELEYAVHILSRLNKLLKKLGPCLQEEILQEIVYLVTDPLEECATKWETKLEVIRSLEKELLK